MTNRHAFIAGLFTLGLAGLFAFWQWNLLQGFQVQTSALTAQISQTTELSQRLVSDYQKVKTAATNARKGSAQALSTVFPSSEDVTGLTRLLDDFAVKTNFEANPFFISSMKFSPAVEVEKGLSFLPVSLTLTTSRKNLSKFLEMIEQSGSLEAGIRLMDVQDLALTYPMETGGTYEAQVTLHAYFSSL